MNIGLIGLGRTGKTTLFRLLTGRDEKNAGAGKGFAATGPCRVPDGRIDFLSQLYNPKKTTYAKIDAVDVAGFTVSQPGHGSEASKFLDNVRNCDALVHVLRAFDSAGVPHDLGDINPARDLELVETEILFADLEMIEKRISKIKEGKKVTKEHEAEIALLEICNKQLEEQGTIIKTDFSEDDLAVLQKYSFLTDKPRLVVINLDEKQYTSAAGNTQQEITWNGKNELTEYCEKMKYPVLELCVDMELEISLLPQEDKAAFMEDLGVSEPGIAVLAGAVYQLLGLISFLTVGEDEVRAWTIKSGTTARSAAGKIHSDIERGFIRAEVVKYEDLHNLGSMAKVKEKGLFRLEGKEYIVADGDVINFRFNV